jgi:hypothetical protein
MASSVFPVALVIVVALAVGISSTTMTNAVEAFAPSFKIGMVHQQTYSYGLRAVVGDDGNDDGDKARDWCHKVSCASDRRHFMNRCMTTVGSSFFLLHASNPVAVHAADDVKTMDLSLPSYDSINTLKSSEAERGLGVENPSASSSSSKSPVTKKSSRSSSSSSSGGGGNPLGSILPSMNKSVTKKPMAPKSDKVDGTKRGGSTSTAADDAGIKTMDLSLPSYSDNTKAAEKGMFSL